MVVVAVSNLGEPSDAKSYEILGSHKKELRYEIRGESSIRLRILD